MAPPVWDDPVVTWDSPTERWDGLAGPQVVAPRLNIPLTFFSPAVTYPSLVVAPQLAVGLTFFAPVVSEIIPSVPQIVAATPLEIGLTFFAPDVFGPGGPSWFTPPIESFLKVPPSPRTDWLEEMAMASGIPRSPKWRQFLGNHLGREVVIDGVTYGGGRWHGPLTEEQINAITAAGYGDRIVQADEPGLLPATID